MKVDRELLVRLAGSKGLATQIMGLTYSDPLEATGFRRVHSEEDLLTYYTGELHFFTRGDYGSSAPGPVFYGRPFAEKGFFAIEDYLFNRGLISRTDYKNFIDDRALFTVSAGIRSTYGSR